MKFDTTRARSPLTRMRSLIAGAGVAVVLAASLSACSAAAPSEAEPKQKDAASQVLTVGAGVGDALESPWLNGGTPEQTLLFRALFLPEADLTTVKPDLASDFKVADDGLSLTVTLKDDVKWADGEPLTPADVVWSVTTALKVSQINALYVGEFSKIQGAAAVLDGSADALSGLTVDGNVITFALSEPSMNFVPALGQFSILPAHLLESADPLELHNDPFWRKPVGNGMYQIDEFNPSSFIRLVPSETYEGTAPKISEVVIRPSVDPASDAAAGDIDYFWTNDVAIIQRMADVKGFTAHQADVLFYRYFVMNVLDNPLLADVRVREALLMAMDREGMAKSIYGGVAKLINSGVPADSADAASGLNSFDYDPDRATELLKEAGFDFSKTLRLRSYYDDPVSQAFMTAVSQQLQDIGIKVELLAFQGDATTELYETRNYDLSLKGLSGFSLAEWYQEYTGTNFQKIIGAQPELVALNSALTKATSEKETTAALAALQEWEQKNMLKLPAFTIDQFHYVSDRVKTGDNWGNPFYRYDRGFENWTLG